MLGLTKKSNKPTTYYALALCIHVVAFIMMVIGMFTPYWSEITEQVGTTGNDVTYDRGLIVSCSVDDNCRANSELTQSSDVYFTAFILGIVSIILGFFALQLFLVGICVKSCREANLGMPIAVMSIIEGALLTLVLVFFEISLGRDTTTGNRHRDDDFGFSRGIIIGAIVLYWLSAFIILGEYVRRRLTDVVEKIPFRERQQKAPQRAPPSFRQAPADAYRGNKRRIPPTHNPNTKNTNPTGAYPMVPPPYTRTNPAYAYDDNTGYKTRNDTNHGMKACNKPDCTMCRFVAEMPTFWGPAGVFNINDRITCQDSGLVYAVICMTSDKTFIGHTNHRLEDALKYHISNINSLTVSDPVAYHFTRNGRTIQDLRITGLARINCDPDTRARLEKCLSYDMDRPHNSYYGINSDFEFL